MPQTNFVQLTPEDCNYLLSLIQEMDSETPYTERQRGFTIPKLQKLSADPSKARLADQDLEYLLELVEDDENPDFEQQRLMTFQTLQEIQALKENFRNIMATKDQQRNLRKARRTPVQSLQEHFQGPQVK